MTHRKIEPHEGEVEEKSRPLIPKDVTYFDWNESLPILESAYRTNELAFIIRPKGTGKTTLVRKFAELKQLPVREINFSLRTREIHLVGTKELVETEDGSKTEFQEGILPKSMRKGGILYLDDVCYAEAEVLTRLNEAMDDRRQLVLKEDDNELIKADESWWVVAAVNPLSHAGAKEMPPQLISRLPVRISLDYPPGRIEKKIVRMHLDNMKKETRENLDLALGIDRSSGLVNDLRDNAKEGDLQYSPSIRETISFAKLIESGLEPKTAATVVFENIYRNWDAKDAQQVHDLIVSYWGE